MLSRHPGVVVDIGFVPVRCDRPRRFTSQQIADYNRFGYVTHVPLLDDPYVQNLAGFFDAHWSGLVAGSTTFEAYHHKVREMYDLVTRPEIVEHIQDLAGPDVVCHTSAYINKPPGDPRPVAWHQDCSYNPMDSRCPLLWLALDDVDIENGCMWFIPGSHLLGQLEFDSAPFGLETRNAESFGARVPIELKRGEAVFFSDLLLHSSQGNGSKVRHRRAFNATYAPTSLKPRLDGKSQWAVICSGADPQGNWLPHHPRP